MPEYRARPGRPKSALPAEAGPAVTALKEWLRKYVGDTSLEKVAAAATYSVSTVSNALGGTELPRLRLVQSIAAAIDAPQALAHRMWWKAALEEFTKDNPPRPDDPVTDYARQLRHVMLRSDLGKATVLRNMTRLCDNTRSVITPMSRATLCRLLDGTTLPNPEQMSIFLRVINATDTELARLTARYQELATARARATRPTGHATTTEAPR
jgi:hypothetical protein